jgi:hypothetical protein
MSSIFGVRESLATHIRNYGTAVTVGVFIGAALTTGLACGVAAFWATSSDTLRAFESVVTGAGRKALFAVEAGARAVAAGGRGADGRSGASAHSEAAGSRTVHARVAELERRVAALEGSQSWASASEVK